MPAVENIPYNEPKFRDGNFANLSDELLYRILVAVRSGLDPKPLFGQTIENTTFALPENAIWFSVAPASSEDEYDIHWSPAFSTTSIKIAYASPEVYPIRPAEAGQPITITARGKLHVSWLTDGSATVMG